MDEPADLAEPAAAPAPEAPPAPDYKDLYLRALAELDNYRKRVDKDRAAWAQGASEAILRRLLDPLDSLERAAADLARLQGEVHGDAKALVARSAEGLRALVRQFEAVTASEGMRQIPAEGAEFDPALHEALARVPHATVPAGTVIQVLRPGYTVRGRLLRAAAVAVSAGPAEGKAAAEGAPRTHETAPTKGTPEKHKH